MDEPILETLRGVTADVDQDLSEAVDEKLDIMVARNRAEDILLEHSTHVCIENG